MGTGMNAWRKELLDILAETPCRRKPALRRSLLEDAIYATDLPLVSSEEGLRSFRGKAEQAGWRLWMGRDWLQLDRSGTAPPEGWFSGPFGPEAGCCASLLRRQAWAEEDQTAFRLLIRAGEEGPGAYERACGALHREWAARLRQKRPLPRLDLRFFEE